MQIKKQQVGSLLLVLSALFAGRGFGADGGATFKAKCAGCHGADAAGATVMGKKFKLRDLRSADVQKQTDEELTALITNGKVPMPAFGKTLDAATIHDLVAYLRSIAAKS